MRTFFQTSMFSAKLDGLRGAALLLELIETEILSNPEAGAMIPRCGGVQKLRVKDPTLAEGKSGGYRVLHFDLSDRERTYLITFNGKREADNISAGGKKLVRGIAHAIREEQKWQNQK